MTSAVRVVVIRCDGSSTIGMGHVSRCLALADELRDTYGCTVTFAMRGEASAGVQTVRAAGYGVALVPDGDREDYGPALRHLLAATPARVLIADVLDGLSRASLDACRADGALVVTVDDVSERRLGGDLAFCPPVPQFAALDWRTFGGRLCVGWEWVILKREFAHGEGPGERLEAEGPSPACDVLVTMGGSDPAGMTPFAIDALEHLEMPLAVQVVLGPAFARTAGAREAMARSHHAMRTVRAPASMAPLMRASRIAVSSFGVSAYELAACGVPAVHLCMSDDHALASSAFEREGIARTAGVFGRVTAQQVADAVRWLLAAAGRRAEMAARAWALVDGRGAARVARTIIECAE